MVVQWKEGMRVVPTLLCKVVIHLRCAEEEKTFLPPGKSNRKNRVLPEAPPPGEAPGQGWRRGPPDAVKIVIGLTSSSIWSDRVHMLVAVSSGSIFSPAAKEPMERSTTVLVPFATVLTHRPTILANLLSSKAAEVELRGAKGLW